jgi:hypothetical protein|nr:hypothetical protein [Candidatus Acidoferrales bacterium]
MASTETKTRRVFNSAKKFLYSAFLFFTLIGAASAGQLPDSKDPAMPQSAGQSTSQTPAAQAPRQETTHQIPTMADQTIGLLSRRSIFFPDLATTLKPLSAEQKFKLSLDQTIAPSTLVSAVVVAGYRQAENTYPGYGQEWGGYGKRFGAAMANSASTNFLGSFLIPSWLHQDPRYFISLRPSFRKKMEYALTRQIITRTDDGRSTFNWSRVIGVIGAEGIANIYLPAEERTVGKTFERSGIRFGIGIGTTLLKEYWPMIFKKLGVAPVGGNGIP